MVSSFLQAVTLLLGGCAVGNCLPGLLSLRGLPPPPDDATVAQASEPQYFEQWVDHKNHSLGTFAQRWWYDTNFWTGPGAPVSVEAPFAETGSWTMTSLLLDGIRPTDALAPLPISRSFYSHPERQPRTHISATLPTGRWLGP